MNAKRPKRGDWVSFFQGVVGLDGRFHKAGEVLGVGPRGVSVEVRRFEGQDLAPIDYWTVTVLFEELL